MPEHVSFFSYLVEKLFAAFPALQQNLAGLKSVVPYAQGNGGTPIKSTRHDAEALMASAFVMVMLILFALSQKRKLSNHDQAVIPDAKLSLRTIFEMIIGYFYDVMKEMMGPKKAKRFFPVIGTCACFILFSNILGLIPGFIPPTSSWNITAGCAFVVFIAFNYYGLKENGWNYIKHYAGPIWWMAWLIFPLEVFSMLIRPFTLSLRLMLNMAVDHLLLGVVTMMIAIFIPLPLMVLGTLVSIIQVIVFCMLSSIYIANATEDHDHGAEHAHAAPAHA